MSAFCVDATLAGLAPGHWDGDDDAPGLVPSVTTILGRVLRDPEVEKLREQLGADRCDAIMDAAAAFGTRVHEVCGLANAADDIPLDDGDPVLDHIAAEYRVWADAAIEEVAGVELPFVNSVDRYGGTIDLIARFRGDRDFTVVDLKTSAKLGVKYRLQTAAYFEGACASLGYPVGRRVIVHIDKRKARELRSGVIRIVEYTDHASDFAAFLNALNLYRWLEGATA